MIDFNLFTYKMLKGGSIVCEPPRSPSSTMTSKHCINVLNPERHGGDGLNNSYISYEITSHFVNL